MTHAPYNYALAPYVPYNDNGMQYWGAPAWAMAGIDLGSLGDCAQAAGDHRPVGLFWGTDSPDSNAAVLGNGDCREIPTTAAMRSAWKSSLGYMPNGATLLDLLNDQLTSGSDPTGQATVKPLMPTVEGNLEIWMPGHSLVRSEAFVLGKHPHTNRVLALLQNDYAAMWDAEQAGHQKPGQRLKVLDFWMKQYRVSDPDQFLPRAHKGEKPLPHATSYTDNFTRADASTLGASWGVATGAFHITSNTCTGTSGDDEARYESDVSSSDHYAQVDCVSGISNQDVCARWSSSVSTTFYLVQVGNLGKWNIYKRVSGTYTQLQFASASFSAGTVTCQCSGSTITGKYTSLVDLTATDTAITGNLRGGLRSATSTNVYDNFMVSDLVASSLIYTQLERDVRGLSRGIFTYNRGG